MTDRLLNVEQARRKLNCHRTYVYKLLDAGKLRGFKLGIRKGYRIYEDSLEAFLQRREEAFAEVISDYN